MTIALQQLQAAQQELIQSEKMVALGQLVAGIAHEINTPLGAIRASIGNITTALTHSIQQLPQLFGQLSPERQADFFALLETARQNQQTLSTREERQLKRALKQELEAQGLDNADTLAATLVQLGITRDIADFMPLLQEKNNTFILETAYNLLAQQINSVLSAGCDDFVRKPFREQVIFEKMAQYLGVRYYEQPVHLESTRRVSVREGASGGKPDSSFILQP